MKKGMLSLSRDAGQSRPAAPRPQAAPAPQQAAPAPPPPPSSGVLRSALKYHEAMADRARNRAQTPAPASVPHSDIPAGTCILPQAEAPGQPLIPTATAADSDNPSETL